MKALILVGGYGTRLRPLTINRPKPLVEFCNKPMVMHQIEQLVKAGVDHIILAVSYMVGTMNKFVEEQEKLLGIKITLSHETKPLGTAGPLKLAEKHLLGESDDGEPFFVLNSDIICDYPFRELLEFHKDHCHEGTIVVTRVEEPSKYGVVVYDSATKNQIESFVEKPKEFVSNKINAGIYLFNKSILKRIESDVATSIERIIFPEMARDGQLHAMVLKGYWMDIGQPPDYLKGMSLFLRASAEGNVQNVVVEGSKIVGNVLIHKSAIIGKDCQIGPDVCIGPNVIIDDGLLIKRSTILEGSRLKSHSRIDNSIVGWNCIVGRWVQMENTCVLAENIQIEDEVYLNGAKVLPNKTISTSVHEPSVIM